MVLIAAAPQPQPLLLPPLLSGPEGQPLAEPLAPLLQRAAATASLQGRPWQGPAHSPMFCAAKAAAVFGAISSPGAGRASRRVPMSRNFLEQKIDLKQIITDNL